MLLQMPKKAEEKIFAPDCAERKRGQNWMSRG